MATKIPPETLNALLVAREVHVGVYLTHERRSSVVVKVSKEGKVYFLRLEPNSSITLEATDGESFLRRHPVELFHYPVRRAVRRMASWVRTDKFPISDEARKVINAILER